MKKLIVGAGIAILCTGCLGSMITNSLVPNNTNKVQDNVLAYNKEIYNKTADSILAVKEDGKKLKYIDRANARANKGGKVGFVEQGLKQVIGNTGRAELEPIVNNGVSWVRDNAVPLLTGVLGIGGLGGGLGVRKLRRRGALNRMYADTADEGTKEKMRENVKYTGLEKEIV